MAPLPFPLPPAGAPGTNLMSIDQKNWRRYPSEPITKAMTDRVNVEGERHPDHQDPADWTGGETGDDIDQSKALVVNPDYTPRHQGDRLTAGNWSADSVAAADVGKDYGEWSGNATRTGTIEPDQPYPQTLAPTTVTPDAFLPSNFVPAETVT